MTDRLDTARLDELWDFGDPAASERRFRLELDAAAPRSQAKGEWATQLARSLGLQERFVEADAILDTVNTAYPLVLIRSLLERGRLRNSAGNPAEAVPLFEEALAAAAAEREDYLAVDAAHMLAIADTERAERWTARGLETIAETTDARTRRWAIGLHNNLGWARFDAGALEEALVEFELAADAARDFGTDAQRRWAQEAIDETLAALARRA
jgi:tetratricopeptide (TPR) repeat protein